MAIGSGTLVTLAGFAADDSVWAEFDREWWGILHQSKRTKAQRPLPSHAGSHERERPLHVQERMEPEKKVGNLVTDLLMFMQNLDKRRSDQFACTIDLSVYRKLIAKAFWSRIR